MQELRTKEQVEEYLRQAHIYPQDREIYIYQTEFAWVCWEPMNPSEQDRARRTPGTGGCHIVDARTGVVTSYGTARPPIVWGEMYDEAIRTGEPMVGGGQIYPHRWRLNIQWTQEDPTEIEYLVTVESLTEPPEPTTEIQLIMNKETLHSRTNVSGIPEAANRAIGWVVANRKNKTWPEQLTHEF